MKLVDVDNWKRKEHYNFFSKFVSPYFGVVSEIDCTNAYSYAKENNLSFFAYYLHRSMMAVNSIPEFRYRIIDDKVYEFETIHAGATAGRDDETFAFIFVPYSSDFSTFNRDLQRELDEVKKSSGLRLNGDDEKFDLIRHSTLPWISFTALLHPTNFVQTESVPRITFGKVTERDGRKYLPVSVEAHHGLMDGLHVAKYFEEFQRLLDL